MRVDDQVFTEIPFKDGWTPLPDTGIPELDALCEDHARIKAQWDTEKANVINVKNRIDEDTKRREGELREAFGRGDTDSKIETEDKKLAKELDQARERRRAAYQAFIDIINQVIETVAANYSQWSNELGVYENERGQIDVKGVTSVSLEIADLEVKLADARKREAGPRRLARWLHRTGVRGFEHASEHYPYSTMPDAPPIEGTPEEQAWKNKLLETAFIGGTTHIRMSPAEEAQRVRAEDNGEPEPIIDDPTGVLL